MHMFVAALQCLLDVTCVLSSYFTVVFVSRDTKDTVCGLAFSGL